MQVLKLSSNQPADRFYRGGGRIAEFRGQPPGSGRTPEDWLASTTPLFGETELGLTRLPDGKLLRTHVEEDPYGWLGSDHVRWKGADTSLLVKLLDAGERLPVHLHPDRDFGAKHLNSCYGKTEAWIAMSPCEVHLGFVEEILAEDLARWVAAQDVESMLAAMNTLSLAAGDAVLVPAGLPHAIGAGAFIVELQEPTDLSVLLEWRGFAIDGDRDGRIGLDWPTALSATDRTAWNAGGLSSLRIADAGTTGSLLPPGSEEFFVAERHRISDTANLDAGYSVIVVTSGSGTLIDQGGATLPIERGDTLLSPHAAGVLEVTGRLELIRCRPPRPPADDR